MQLIETLRAALDTIDACGSIDMDKARALIAEWDAMTADEKLIMDLATPATVDDACRLLRHPLEQAQAFAESRQTIQPENAEFWRRLAGSIRKARGMI